MKAARSVFRSHSWISKDDLGALSFLSSNVPFLVWGPYSVINKQYSISINVDGTAKRYADRSAIGRFVKCRVNFFILSVGMHAARLQLERSTTEIRDRKHSFQWLRSVVSVKTWSAEPVLCRSTRSFYLKPISYSYCVGHVFHRKNCYLAISTQYAFTVSFEVKHHSNALLNRSRLTRNSTIYSKNNGVRNSIKLTQKNTIPNTRVLRVFNVIRNYCN